jgi:DNA repair exonuclease SbcCD nuclease subunit
MEIEDLRKIVIPKETNNFRILMLHTSIKEAVGDLPIESISMKSFPKADYYALGHLHINFNEKLHDKPIIYSGPIFPNSFQELDDLCYGRFYMVTVEGYVEPKRQDIILKEVVTFKINIENALTATQQIIDELEKHELTDKIVLMKLFGEIKKGTNADIDYPKIEEYLKSKKVYSFLKNTNKLVSEGEKIDIKISEHDVNKIEETLVKEYELKNPNKFNNLIVPLMHSLELQKQEDEKSAIYEARLFSELNKILGLELK